MLLRFLKKKLKSFISGLALVLGLTAGVACDEPGPDPDDDGWDEAHAEIESRGPTKITCTDSTSVCNKKIYDDCVDVTHHFKCNGTWSSSNCVRATVYDPWVCR